jgi:cytochrome c biogenesis protein CcmG, thiol:disulfide interchange protein DsbE
MDSTAAAAAGDLRRGPRRPVALWAITAAVVIVVAVVALLVSTGSPAKAHGSLQPAKNFRLPELGHPGQYVSLAAYAGRPVIINFFASWCPPCQRETPLIAKFYQEHHGQVLIIGVDSNDEASKALQFVKAKGVSYPIGFDAYPMPVTLSYGIVALPQTFMLNAKHQIVQHISGDVTERELQAWARSLAGARKT